ncbi:MAG: hypothetical protein HKN26_09275 [Acidimicrobiales bacterium]|nr:hypothetical protein [Acidimicrobiales bacterium]
MMPAGRPVREPVVVQLAGWRLPNSPIRITNQPLGDEAFAALLRDATRHKLIGVLAGAVGEGSIPVTPGQFEQVAEHHEAAMQVAIELEQTLLAAVDVLAEVDVEPIVLKGSALARTVALEPEHRTFGDVDLLVRSTEIPAVVAAFEGIGARRAFESLGTEYDRRFAKSITMRWKSHEIDIHRTLAPGPFGLRISEADLHRDRVPFDIGGRSLLAFDPERHLVHACLHAALGDVEPFLANQRDIGLLVTQPGLNHVRVLDLAARWKLEAPVAKGLLAAAKRLRLPASTSTAWAGAYRPSRQERFLLASYQREQSRFRRTAAASLLVLPWRDRPAYLRALTRRKY